MDKNVECALQSFPKHLIVDAVNSLMRTRIKSILDDDDFLDEIDERLKKRLILGLESKCKEFVENYISKNGEKIITDAIKCYIDDNGIPEEAESEMVDVMVECFIEKFKKVLK